MMAQDKLIDLRDEANRLVEVANMSLPARLKLRHASDIQDLDDGRGEFFTLLGDANGYPTDRIYNHVDLNAVFAHVLSLAVASA